MTILPRWLQRISILNADSNGPWSNGGSGSGGSGGDGPRNPWAPPPGGKPKPTALDEFLKRARNGGGGGPVGGGGSGSGRFNLPGGGNARTLWTIGVALILGVWVIYTSFHPISPSQRGVVTWFGKYAGTLDPGIRLTLPAPIASVTKVDVQRTNTEDFPDGGGSAGTQMLTGDQNIVDLAYSVSWNIKNPQDFIFQIKDPRQTVRAAAESAMRSVIATSTLNDVIGSGQNVIQSRVQEELQQILDSYNSGVNILGVAIKQAGPPEQVVDAFKDVTAAQQDARGAINRSRGYAQQVIAKAQGEAAAFDKVYEQYRLAPEVTRRRMYYETMEQVLAKSDKTIVEAPGVVPYLPLRGNRRLPDPEMAAPEPQAAPAAPAPQAGAAQ